MRTELKRRLEKLEGDHTGPILQGFVQLDDAGNLSGVATFYDDPDPELTTWLKTFTPNLESRSLALMLFTDYPDPDRTHLNTVPACDLHPEVKRLLTPYLRPGAQVHWVDGREGDLNG